jgi:hypothetical protein
MKIIQYRPNYYSGYENKEVEFSTLEELLNISWVKSFSDDEYFYRYSCSDGYLMAECNKGYDWHVIGSLSCPSISGLPKWKARYKPKSKKQIAEEKRLKKLEKIEKDRIDKIVKQKSFEIINQYALQNKKNYETMAQRREQSNTRRFF